MPLEILKAEDEAERSFWEFMHSLPKKPADPKRCYTFCGGGFERLDLHVEHCKPCRDFWRRIAEKGEAPVAT